MQDFPFEFFTMALSRVVIKILCIALVDAIMLEHVSSNFNSSDKVKSDPVTKDDSDLNDAFNGVYSECLIHLSYTCLQKKTLHYLKDLDGLPEISVIGDYVKFVKLNNSEDKPYDDVEESSTKTSEELSNIIDKAVDNFFNNHMIRFSALGKHIVVPHTVEEFVGRKRRKGGGGGHGGGDDGGKKKMMMMAMMCMKMKLMMMVPAMMGMMGMMSFKGMMFSMMSFMISKMMLLMKILEKKGGGGGGGGGGDGSWASGGGGGAWMPAGGQDYGGGGGYDSNAQWSSRSILEKEEKPNTNVKPVVTYIKPSVRYNNLSEMKRFSSLKKINEEVIKANNKIDEPKSRNKRGLIDALQNAYMYWTSKVLGFYGYKQKRVNYPKYKIINGVKYVYSPIRYQKVKAPKELPVNNIKMTDDPKPIVITDFNKGEIVEDESRMNRRQFHKMNENVSETLDDNPWE